MDARGKIFKEGGKFEVWVVNFQQAEISLTPFCRRLNNRGVELNDAVERQNIWFLAHIFFLVFSSLIFSRLCFFAPLLQALLALAFHSAFLQLNSAQYFHSLTVLSILHIVFVLISLLCFCSWQFSIFFDYLLGKNFILNENVLLVLLYGIRSWKGGWRDIQ